MRSYKLPKPLLACAAITMLFLYLREVPNRHTKNAEEDIPNTPQPQPDEPLQIRVHFKGELKGDTNENLQLPSGIPTTSAYLKLLKDPAFGKVEEWSNNWVVTNIEVLKPYPWVKDSFHWWSRQWEYMYMIQAVREHAKSAELILDLGSGVTFLPYLLKDQIKGLKIDALDYDSKYPTIFEGLNKNMGPGVTFRLQDLRKSLEYLDNSIDLVYCVSVLEHTDNYPAIVDEVKRVLKPGGIFVLSIDISFDDQKDFMIAIDDAEKLIGYLRSSLQEVEVEISDYKTYNHYPLRRLLEKKEDEIVTPQMFSDPDLEMQDLFKKWHLTFTCHTFRKPLYTEPL